MVSAIIKATTGLSNSSGTTQGRERVFKNTRGLGNIYVFYRTLVTGTYGIFYAYSSDGGSNWTIDQTVDSGTEIREPSFSVTYFEDGANSQLVVYICWIARTGGASEEQLKVRRGTIADASQTISWGTTQNLADRCKYVSMVIDNNGYLHIGYQKFDGTNYQTAIRSSSNAFPTEGQIGAWGAETTLDTANTNSQGHVPTLCPSGTTRAFTAFFYNQSAVNVGNYRDWNGTVYSNTGSFDDSSNRMDGSLGAAAIKNGGDNAMWLLFIDVINSRIETSKFTIGTGWTSAGTLVRNNYSACTIARISTNKFYNLYTVSSNGVIYLPSANTDDNTTFGSETTIDSGTTHNHPAVSLRDYSGDLYIVTTKTNGGNWDLSFNSINVGTTVSANPFFWQWW